MEKARVGMGSRVWDNSRRNIKSHQAEFVDMDPLSTDSRLNMEECTVNRCLKFA